jgi:two-component sensor histidine kinase
MGQALDSSSAVWMAEAAHRAANLEQIATNLPRLIDRGRVGSNDPSRTIRQANRLAKTYRSLDSSDGRGSFSCAPELKNIAYGLTAIFGHSVGSVNLWLDIQPLMLEQEERRALLLAASELVMNALRHAFVGRHSGTIRISLHWDEAREEGVLEVADDGKGPDDVVAGTGLGHGIIRGLADVLDGSIAWRRSMLLLGTEAVLRFPLPTPALQLAPGPLE